MKRICIVGNSGAGKSTLSNTLATRLTLPVFYLDKYFWAPGWKKKYATKEEFTAVVDTLARQDAWIIDGNYISSNIDFRFERADTIIFLDFPKYRCIWRVLIRVLDRTQPVDKAEGVKQKVSWELLVWMARFNAEELREKVENHRKNKSVHIAKNNKEIRLLLNKLHPSL